MTKVIDLEQYRQQQAAKTEVSVADLVQEHIDLLNMEWHAYRSSNRLNAWISLRVFGDIVEDNYFDLNVISKIEIDLQMAVVLFYPRTFNPDDDMYRAGFHYGEMSIAGPPWDNEIDARLYNIALYLEILKDARIKI